MVRSVMIHSTTPVRHDTGLSEDLAASQEYPKARIILVGDSGTGKTSLVQKLATGIFEPMCSPTIGIHCLIRVQEHTGGTGYKNIVGSRGSSYKRFPLYV